MSADLVLDVRDLTVAFPQKGMFWGRRRALKVVRDVTFSVARGEAVGIVGESGSGKSTIARAIAGLGPSHRGEIRLAAAGDITERPRVQMVFQDPFASFDPLMEIGAQINEALAITRAVPRADRRVRVETLLAQVGLDPASADRLPRAFSGGQLQRASIARALAGEPDLLIADEATSALDLSVQSQILNVLMDLRDDLGLALLFITHDLGVVEVMCDRVIVLYRGRIVEIGPTLSVMRAPMHPYTHSLVSAHGLNINIPKDQPDVAGLPEAHSDGCPYAMQCPRADALCSVRPGATGRGAQAVFCHHPLGATG